MLNVELDLSINPNASFWNKICKNIYLMTKKRATNTVQDIHRFHLTGQKLFKM